jgi:hypothetical protein
MYDLAARRGEKACAITLTILAALTPMLVTGWTKGMAAAAVGFLLLCALGAGFWCAGWLGGPRSLIQAVWRSDGTWSLTSRDGRRYEASLRPETRMSPALIWLRWNAELPLPPIVGRVARKPRQFRKSLLLIPGDLPAADFRRLLVRLRLDQSECAPNVEQANLTPEHDPQPARPLRRTHL